MRSGGGVWKGGEFLNFIEGPPDSQLVSKWSTSGRIAQGRPDASGR